MKPTQFDRFMEERQLLNDIRFARKHGVTIGAITRCGIYMSLRDAVGNHGHIWNCDTCKNLNTEQDKQ